MKVTLRPSVTIDGFIADQNGECYSWINPDDEERYMAAVKACGCELTGRKTYQQYQDDFDGRTEIINYVYTTQTTFKDTHNVKFVSGSPKEVLARIERDGFDELIISGGGELNGSLAEAGLINEMHLSVHPIILGSGIPLLGSHNGIQLKLELIGINTDVAGITLNSYRVINE